MSPHAATTDPMAANRVPIRFEFKSPAEAFRDAINFDNASQEQTTTNGVAGKGNDSINETRWRSIVRRLNNTQYIYPGISIISVVSCTIGVLLLKSVSWIVKAVMIVILLLFIVYTVFQFRDTMEIGERITSRTS